MAVPSRSDTCHTPRALVHICVHGFSPILVSGKHGVEALPQGIRREASPVPECHPPQGFRISSVFKEAL